MQLVTTVNQEVVSAVESTSTSPVAKEYLGKEKEGEEAMDDETPVKPFIKTSKSSLKSESIGMGQRWLHH